MVKRMRAVVDNVRERELTCGHFFMFVLADPSRNIKAERATGMCTHFEQYHPEQDKPEMEHGAHSTVGKEEKRRRESSKAKKKENIFSYI